MGCQLHVSYTSTSLRNMNTDGQCVDSRNPARGGDRQRHLPCRCSLLVWPVHACRRVGAAPNGDGAPPGHPTHRAYARAKRGESEEVHRQGIELLCCKSMVAAVRRLLRRDGPRAAIDDGRDAGGSWHPPRAREDERLLGRRATRESDSERVRLRASEQCAVSARDLVRAAPPVRYSEFAIWS